ncbi:MAG: hypothetical protein AAFR11_03150 [Pseudomonadota bacterium]
MPILNQSTAWSAVPANVREAFKGEPEKVELPAGMKIYKLSGYPTLVKDGGSATTEVSPWWSPFHAYKWDGGLENRRKTAAAMGGASLKELSRIVVAVREDWSSLDYVATANLKLAVYGFFGVVARQPKLTAGAASKKSGDERGSTGGGNLLGSAGQLYIPSLTLGHLENVDVQKIA